MDVTVRRVVGAVERISAGDSPVTGSSADRHGTASRGLLVDRRFGSIDEAAALTPHAGAGGEAVVVGTLVVATCTVAIGFVESVDERTHPAPSAFAPAP